MGLIDDGVGRVGIPATPGRRGARRVALFAGATALVLAAFLLRVHGIGNHELWLDEAYSRYTLDRGLSTLAEGSTPPLYFLLLRAWTALAGTTETSLRLLSAIAGTLFVAAVIWVGWDIAGARAGMWSGAIAATAPIHIYYSQEARAYALMTLTLILTYGALWRAVRTQAWRWWGAVSLGATLALYTHYFAVLGLVPTIFLVRAWPERPPWRAYGAALLVSGVLVLPWILWSATFPVDRLAGSSWIRDAWRATPPALAIPLSVEIFGLGSQGGLIPLRLKQFTDLAFPEGLRILGVAMLCALGVWLAVPWGDQRIGVPGMGKVKLWLGLHLVVPLVALWVASLQTVVYAVGRYDLVAYPPVPLLLGLALSKLQGRKSPGLVFAAVAAVLLALPIGTKLVLYYRAPTPRDFRPTAAMLDAVAQPGDVVVFAGPVALPVLYYMEEKGYRWERGYCEASHPVRRFACRIFPLEMERRPATIRYGRVLSSPESVREDADRYLRMLSPGGTVWVVYWEIEHLSNTILVPRVDLLLTQELRRQGMTVRPLGGSHRIVAFQRS